jgi:hypothetical protein
MRLKITMVVALVVVLTGGAGCIAPTVRETPYTIGQKYEKEQTDAENLKLNRLKERLSELKTEYQACKAKERGMLDHLDGPGKETYRFCKQRLQESVTEAMNQMFYSETPALATQSNPKGLSVEWWLSPIVYKSQLGIARKNMDRCLEIFYSTEISKEFKQLLHREYEIRDQADDVFFKMQQIKKRLRQIPSQAWEIKNVPYSMGSPSGLNPQQAGMFKLMLDEQEDLLHRPGTIEAWWNYQETFGFDDYKPLMFRSRKGQGRP